MMKRLNIFLKAQVFLLVLCFYVKNETLAQQNLIVNGGFEQFVVCPIYTGEIGKAAPWQSVADSPDFYNACATVSCYCGYNEVTCAGIPSNCFGHRFASSGDGYAGLFTYISNDSDFREVIGTELTSQMQTGQKYFIKFKASFSWGKPGGYRSNVATSGLGIRFTRYQHSISFPTEINNISHVYIENPITDTSTWTTIFKSFIADSNYSFAEVGNFFTDANTLKASQYISPSIDMSYYYIDDFCVSTDSLFALNFSVGLDNKGSSQNNLSFFPNPAKSTVYFNSWLNDVELIVTNLFGAEIINTTLFNKSYYDLYLPEGLYFIQIRNRTKVLLYDKLLILN